MLGLFGPIARATLEVHARRQSWHRPHGSNARRSRRVAGMKPGYSTILSKNRLLGQLDPQMMEELLTLSRVETFAPKESIFLKGDPGDCLYAILKGRVGITTVAENGKEILLNILTADEVFGEIALLDGGKRTADAVAIGPTDLLTIDRSDFLPFLERNPKLCIRLMNVLCERIRWTSEIIEDTIFLDIPHRLAKRLLTLVTQYGKPVETGTEIDLNLSQENLARMFGVTRESVNKGIRYLEENDIISCNRGRINVRDIEALKKLVHCDEDS